MSYGGIKRRHRDEDLDDLDETASTVLDASRFQRPSAFPVLSLPPSLTSPVPIEEHRESCGEPQSSLNRGEEEGEGEKETEITLAFHAVGFTIAAAYFDPDTRMLHIMEDTKDTDSWDLACLEVMEQVRPTNVVVTSRTPDSLVDKVEQYCDQNPLVNYFIDAHKSYTAGRAGYTLSRLRLPDRSQPSQPHFPPSCPTTLESSQILMEGRYQEEGMGQVRLAIVKLGCWVNVDAPGAIGVAAGLITYLEKRGNILGDGGGIELSGITALTPQMYMLINHDALTSLNIMGKDKDSLTLFSQSSPSISIDSQDMFNTCVTPLGKKLLHTWFLRPLVDMDEIVVRHDAVAYFCTPAGYDLSKEIKKFMRRIKNVPKLCTDVARSSGRASFHVWRGIAESLGSAIDIGNIILQRNLGHVHSIFEKVSKPISEDLRELASEIALTIDFDESYETDKIAVRPGISEELDICKEQWAGMSILSLTLIEIPPNFCNDNIFVRYFPQLGFLVAIRNRNLNMDEPPGWRMIFENENEEFFKTPQMENLDDHYGDIYCQIGVDMEMVIIRELASKVSQSTAHIIEVMNVMAELDCLIALATAAVTYDLNRPALAVDPLLEIHEGRHIVHETVVGQYVRNDTLLCGGENDSYHSMMILTGANGSGKSAYGKQVALIVFMAQIGSFVPAESAIIGIVDKIYTRVQTRESVSKASSAFMIDLGQVSLALRGCTSRSLLLLDEFGKGTLPTDGAGLLAGVIRYLLETCRPRTIVMTHFHELFAIDSILVDLPIQFCHMQVVFLDEAPKIAYMYKLEPSLADTSNAAECALIHGIPQSVVDRARFVTECLSRFELSKLYEEVVTDEQRDELKDAENLMRRFLSWKIKDDAIDVMEQLKDVLEDRLVYQRGDTPVEEEEEQDRRVRDVSTEDEEDDL
ncbi:hypothetical protein M231_05382 [Tremella mesenterica]|uniref:DNA mismatch repair proteins mutS family domain-containing protein n=1 Tax=Tremella mesenterica TaxID=5217 RepID=A0A4Q1BIB9_TREME|nr:hypothetical protein M231_05382 [Tremella mesenterica]